MTSGSVTIARYGSASRRSNVRMIRRDVSSRVLTPGSSLSGRHGGMSGPGLDGQITRYQAHATPAPINQICSASSFSGTNPMAAPNTSSRIVGEG